MRKMKYCILLCIMLLLPFSINAKEYDVTNYYVNATINTNNTYDITEYYNVLFLEDSSFERKINLRPKVHLTNGKFISYVTSVNNVNADGVAVTESSTSKTYNIKYPLSKFYESYSYTLSYEYNMGADLDQEHDIVFLNIIDGSMSIVANSIQFNIKLPIKVEDEDITFFKNNKKIKKENIDYTLNNNEISGTYSDEIKDDDIISIQVILPNDYFTNTISNDTNINFIFLLLPLITTIVCIILVKNYKNEKVNVSADNLSLIDKFDSAEMAYLYKGTVLPPDLMTLVFKLANDGYISIKNFGSKQSISFKIKKEKEYDKDNAGQKIIFDGLFQNKEELDIDDIKGIFLPYYIDAKRTLDNKKNRKKLFHNISKNIKMYILAFIYVGIVLLQIKPLYNIIDSYVYAIIISIFLSFIVSYLYYAKNKYLRYIVVALSIIIGIVEIYYLIDFKLSVVIYILGVIMSEFSLYLQNKITIRTTYGSQILHEIESFKLDLMSMSDQTFELKLEANPNYFFDMIPYMLIFGLNGWWFNRFGNKFDNPPKWYDSSEVYTKDKLQEFINEVINKLVISLQSGQMYDDELLKQAPNKML